MTALPKGPTPATAAPYPFTPTQDSTGTPTVCHCCGRRAWGIGVGDFKTDPKWLCAECVLLIERVRSARRLDLYETKALDGGVDAVGEYIDSIGGITDLAHYDELNQRMLVKAAWQGCVDRLRKLIAGDVPF